MRWSWKIGSLFSIPVRLHVSMLLIPLLAFGWVSGTGLEAIVTSAVLVVLLFGSVLIHELGHALVARRFGVRTMDIILTPLGGMARLIDMPTTPKHEIAIAVAGPIVSLAIAGAAFGASVVLGFVPVTPLIIYRVLGVLIWVNLMLGLFNLIPALPMDGGRILRGLLALRLNYLKATRIAARIGRVIAIAGGALAFFYLERPWTAIAIAVFVYFSAGMEERLAQWREARRQGAAGFGGAAGTPPGPSPRAQTYTWTARDPRHGVWQTRPSAPPSRNDQDVVVVEGGKVEIISRKNPNN